MDCRPSDGIALSLRCDAELLVDPEVIAGSSVNFSELSGLQDLDSPWKLDYFLRERVSPEYFFPFHSGRFQAHHEVEHEVCGFYVISFLLPPLTARMHRRLFPDLLEYLVDTLRIPHECCNLRPRLGILHAVPDHVKEVEENITACHLTPPPRGFTDIRPPEPPAGDSRLLDGDTLPMARPRSPF